MTNRRETPRETFKNRMNTPKLREFINSRWRQSRQLIEEVFDAR